MSLWNPVYRIQINNLIKTSVTLSNLTITSGRLDVSSQPVAGYCAFTLIETDLNAIDYDINNSVTIQVKDSTGAYVNLFGGFVTDVAISIQTAGSTAISQQISIIAVGALARLARVNFEGNLAHEFDGDRIYNLIDNVLFDRWDEVPSALTWNTYDASEQWQDALNTGLGEIDRPGNYELHSQTGVDGSVLALASRYAISGLGYLFEDAQGRIGYADSTHRADYLDLNGYINLDAKHAYAANLRMLKRAGDVRNSITIAYGATNSQFVTDTENDSIAQYGELAATLNTNLRHQSDAEDQAAFYLDVRSYPKFLLQQIAFPIHSTEIDDADRDALLNVFMGMPVDIDNLPANMGQGQFQGFVEGWTWTASYNRLDLVMTVSELAFSVKAERWEQVDPAETWNSITNTLNWLDATIVA